MIASLGQPYGARAETRFIARSVDNLAPNCAARIYKANADPLLTKTTLLILPHADEAATLTLIVKLCDAMICRTQLPYLGLVKQSIQHVERFAFGIP